MALPLSAAAVLCHHEAARAATKNERKKCKNTDNPQEKRGRTCPRGRLFRPSRPRERACAPASRRIRRAIGRATLAVDRARSLKESKDKAGSHAAQHRLSPPLAPISLKRPEKREERARIRVDAIQKKRHDGGALCPGPWSHFSLWLVFFFLSFFHCHAVAIAVIVWLWCRRRRGGGRNQ